MDVARPFEALIPAIDSSVLSVLADSRRPRTGREIARVAGRSHTAVQRVLDRLVAQGLVDQAKAGRSRVYTLNREHLAAPAIESLSRMRVELFRRLRDAIQGWTLPPTHASVFGSAARGDGTADSDVDIFIVRPKNVDPEDSQWQEQLSRLAESVHAWTGNDTSISEVPEEDLPELIEKQPPVLADVQREAVELSGRNVRDLLGPG